MAFNTKKVIACGTVIKEMMPFLTPEIDYIEMEAGLHLNAEKLKKALQDLIDDITTGTDTIILGYGLCSMAAVGLSASASDLIIPKVDDCVGMFLGSQKNYKLQLEREPGTYFLSKGWIEAGVTLVEEFKQIEERMGKRAAEIVKKRMLSSYKRLAYINMGHQGQEKFREFAQNAAKELNLYFEEIRGTNSLIKQMIHGPWDEQFVVAQPGCVISLDDFKSKKTNNPEDNKSIND